MSELWQKLSPRERGLAWAVLALLVLVVGYWAATRAISRTHELNDTIDLRQQEILRGRRQKALTQRVEEAFAEMAAQHSSEWTEEEIHERLRNEIHRLAMRRPLPAGTSRPVGESNPNARLIQIPLLQAGVLNTGQGYREYQIRFEAAPAPIEDIVAFLTRLKDSPQALRIDGLSLERQPSADLVVATIEVTRTVVDSAPRRDTAEAVAGPRNGVRPDNLARNPSFEDWDAVNARFLDWEAEGCRLQPTMQFATDGAVCLQAARVEPRAAVFQRHALPAGGTYRLEVDITALGATQLEIMEEAGGELFQGGLDAKADGKTYRYEVRFTVPGKPGTQTALRVPYVVLKGEESLIYLDRAVLVRSVG